MIPLPGRRDWMEEAACTSVDPELFFPLQSEVAKAKTAKTICHTCPVREQCLNYALTHNETQGVWGGLTPNERNKLQKLRRTRSSPTEIYAFGGICGEYRGTTTGYSRHNRAGDPPCRACIEGNLAYKRRQAQRQETS